MSYFTNPWFLLLLPVLPLLGWQWLRRRGNALRFPSTLELASFPGRRGIWARWGGMVLRILALGLLVGALAGPRWPDRRTRLESEGIAILMVADVSGSMAEPDFDWDGQTLTRLEAVKKVFRLFVAGGESNDGTAFQGRPHDLIGLVTFASRPESPCPLTLSHTVLLGLLDEARPRTVPGESETNISDALVLAMHRLHSAGSRRKVMVLLSDGEHNVPHPSSGFSPRQAAQVAANLGVRIYTIDAGSDRSPNSPREKTGPAPNNRAEGQRILKEVAHIAQGQYFSVRDTANLLAVLHEIDNLERQPIQSFQYRRFHQGYPWFALGGFLSLVALLALEMTVWQRKP